MELHVVPKIGREIPRAPSHLEVVGRHQNGRYVSIILRPSAEFVARHSRPGQYIVVTFPGLKPRFLALACAPGSDLWELLVDPTQGDLEGPLERLRIGDYLACSMPEGGGYPIHFEDFSDVIVIATGSGVASIISLLKSWRTPKRTTVLYAEKSSADFAFQKVLETRHAQGEFDLKLMVGQRIEDLDLAIEPVSTALILCGSPQTMQLLSGHFMARGVPLEHIFTNV